MKTYKGAVPIGSLFRRLLRKNFKTVSEQNLFGADWSNLGKGRCPWCGGILYLIARNPKMMRCRSKKHKKTFLISTEKVLQWKDEIQRPQG